MEVDADEDSNVSPGDTLRYRITITNFGQLEALEAKLMDLIDPNLKLDTNSIQVIRGGGENDR